MVALHVDFHSNSGAPLLFIHGWGMHGGMWGEVLLQLAARYRVMAVDLPGHGYSAAGKGECFSLDAIVDQLAAQFAGETRLNLCGWSLGGQVALRWAMRKPAQIDRLVLVSSTPCFVQRADWSCAMAEETLADFSASLQLDYMQTLRRFLALQVRGSEQERGLLMALRSQLLSRGAPEPAALQAGLELLRSCDLRDGLSQIMQSALVIAGVRDTLTPVPASEYMAMKLTGAKFAAIEGAAHAPFMSHPGLFVKHITDFLHE